MVCGPKMSGFKNFNVIKAYGKLVKYFVTSYKKKKMVNAIPNSSSLAQKLPRVTSTDKVKKVKDEDLELISKYVLKTIPRKMIRI